MSKIVLYDADGEQIVVKRRLHIPWGSVVLFVPLLVYLVAQGYLLWSRHQQASTATITSGTIALSAPVFTVPYRDEAPTKVTSGIYYKALLEAHAAWRRDLGWRMPLPPLYIGKCSGGSSIACVSDFKLTGSITLVPDNAKDADLKTVFMHEMGHLLGIPHIEGDALMNSVHTAKLDAPTEDAVAFAKWRRKK